VRCPTVRNLDISSLVRVHNELVNYVASKCTSLERLRLHDSCSLPAVSTRSIIQLAHLCPGLTVLDISFTDVSDRGVAALCVLRDLKSLRLCNCQSVAGSTLPQLIMKCGNLEQLNLFATAMVPQTISQYLAKSIGTRALRVNMFSSDDLPVADIWCGICSTVIYSRLSSFVAVPVSSRFSPTAARRCIPSLHSGSEIYENHHARLVLDIVAERGRLVIDY